MTVSNTDPIDRARPGLALWFGLLGGAAAWAVQFVSSYLITEGMCGAAEQSGGGVTGALVIVLAVSVTTFVVAVAAALAGRRVWLRARGDAEEPTGGTAWTGLAGMLLSGVFAFIIAAQVLPVFLAGGCA